MLALFVIAYYLLQQGLRDSDRAMVLAELQGFAHRYASGGIAAVKDQMVEQMANSGSGALFVRIATVDNQTLFADYPLTLSRFRVGDLERQRPPVGAEWIIVPEVSGDEDALEVAVTELPDGRTLEVGLSTAPRELLLERFRDIFGMFALFTVGIGIIVGRLLATQALQPVRALAAFAQEVGRSGALDARVPTRGIGDELDRLADLFNAMLVRISDVIQVMHDSLDNVAHDLRTPLTRLRAVAEYSLQNDHTVPALRDALGNCLEQSQQVIATLNTLLSVAEANAGTMLLKREEVDLHALVLETVDLYREVAEDKMITIETESAASVVVSADRVRLRQIVANTLDNALKYTPRGGRVRINCAERNDYVSMSFADSGPGFAESDLDRVFDRLYRGEQSRVQPGLGLGLSLVLAIARAHGGRVSATNLLPNGACISIMLPHSQDALRLPDD